MDGQAYARVMVEALKIQERKINYIDSGIGHIRGYKKNVAKAIHEHWAPGLSYVRPVGNIHQSPSLYDRFASADARIAVLQDRRTGIVQKHNEIIKEIVQAMH